MCSGLSLIATDMYVQSVERHSLHLDSMCISGTANCFVVGAACVNLRSLTTLKLESLNSLALKLLASADRKLAKFYNLWYNIRRVKLWTLTVSKLEKRFY